MIDRILVALDGSQLAEQVIPFASAVAGAFDAEIILLRVVERPEGYVRGALDSFDWRMERTEAFAYLEKVKRRLQDEGITTDLDVTDGRASEQILETARAREVDLVVVGSHGVGGRSRFRLASTAGKVVFACDMSALVVPTREGVAEGPPFETVIVPVDCTSQSDWSASVAARLASNQGVDLAVLHIVRPPALLDPQGTPHEREIVDEFVTMNRLAATRYAEGLRQRLQSPELTVHSRLEVAEDIAAAIERRAGAEARPLLVLGSRGHSRFAEGPHGDLVAVMLAHSAHPLIVLREPAGKERNQQRRLRSSDSIKRGRAAVSTE